MPKVAVITNAEGRVLGSVRTDQIETETGTIQFQSRPPAGAETQTTSLELELPEDFNPIDELHKELERRATSP
jgi:hypothetical protein